MDLDGGNDDIQFIGSVPSDPVICQICHLNLTAQSPDERQVHYEMHFSDEPIASGSGSGFTKSPLKPSGGPGPNASFKHSPKTKPAHFPRFFKPLPSPEVRNVFWYPAHRSPPPPNFTPGLIFLKKRSLLKSHAKGHTIRAHLCYHRATHVGSEPWDLGWGCGYRNFLMTACALMDQPFQPDYFALMDGAGLPPGVDNLQQWIEEAWRKGYDDEGARQLKRQLVGTKKWIGTAELYVAFSSRGIPCELADFDLGPSKHTQSLTDWIHNYFTAPSPFSSSSPRSRRTSLSLPNNPNPLNVLKHRHEEPETVGDKLRGASPVVVTDKMPLVLQHSGHSRLVVGIEVVKSRGGVGGGKKGEESVNLLVFDPSKRPRGDIRKLALDTYNALAQPESPVSSSTLSTDSGAGPETQSSPHAGPSKILHTLRHPISSAKVKSQAVKRRLGPSTERAEGGPQKRARREQEKEEEVIVIESSGDEAEVNEVKGRGSHIRGGDVEVEWGKVLQGFRVSQRDLGRHDKYQILYFPFPLQEPLSEGERERRKVVRSTKVR